MKHLEKKKNPMESKYGSVCVRLPTIFNYFVVHTDNNAALTQRKVKIPKMTTDGGKVERWATTAALVLLLTSFSDMVMAPIYSATD